jgi:hypothetical protein
MTIVQALLAIALEVAKALGRGDTKRVDEILSGELQSTLIKRAADLEAEAKFGPRQP